MNVIGKVKDSQPARAALNRLLADVDFQRLHAAIEDKSIFHVLGIEHRERSHAAFLAWLLDPRGRHGMGTSPLRRFLLRAAVSAPGLPEGNLQRLDPVAIQSIDLESVQVEKEYHIDPSGGRRLLDIVALLPDNAPCLVVEHKVNASEGAGQTEDCAKWARNHPLTLDDEQYQPLLVYVSQNPPESSAFTWMDYEELLAWLKGLHDLEKTGRAEFLLDEFIHCIEPRGESQPEEISGLADALQERHADALAVLRATSDPLGEFPRIQQAYDRALRTLGVRPSIVASKGPSAFIEFMRDTLRQELSPEHWKVVGGEATLMVISLDVQKRLGRADRLRGQFFMDRPVGGRARYAFEFARPLAQEPEGLPARRRLADSFREFFDPDEIPHAEPSNGNTVLRTTLDLPPIQTPLDDTWEAADQCRDAIDKAIEVTRALELHIARWASAKLPGLLGNLKEAA